MFKLEYNELFKRGVFLLLVSLLSAQPSLGYGGAHGARFPIEAEKCLRKNGQASLCDDIINKPLVQAGSAFNGMNVITIIQQGCMLPDFLPLTNAQVNENSSYKFDHSNIAYNFSALMTTATSNMLALIGLTAMSEEVKTTATYSNIKAWLSKTYYYPTVDLKVSYSFVPQMSSYLPTWYSGAVRVNIELFAAWKGAQVMTSDEVAFLELMAQTATQHTYTYNHIDVNNRSSNRAINSVVQKKDVLNDGGENDAFLPVTIAPWAAEAEYNLALKYWREGDKGMAFLFLGRAAHYIQDITVPHHCEITGNFPDLIMGLIMARTGQILRTSQGQYEADYFDGTFDWTGQAYVFNEARYNITENQISSFNIKTMIKTIQHYMLLPSSGTGSSNMRWIINCDGIPLYWFFDWQKSCLIYDGWDAIARQQLYSKYMRYPEEGSLPLAVVNQLYLDPNFGYCQTTCGTNEAGCLSNVRENYGTNSDWMYWVGDNDNFKGVADTWASIAVNYTAILIAKFCRDVGLIPASAIPEDIR